MVGTPKDKKSDIMDLYRPHSGIRYSLSQTQADMTGGGARLHLTHTRVDYEPGQDLDAPSFVSTRPIARYARCSHVGPVWHFLEEEDDERHDQKRMVNLALRIEKMVKTRMFEIYTRKYYRNYYYRRAGPPWYQELSPAQIASVDMLRASMRDDYTHGTTIHTQETLSNMGIEPRPSAGRVQHLLKYFYFNPEMFLLKLYQFAEPNRKEYSVNDRILLSSIVHLTIRTIFKELHIRIPSPEREIPDIRIKLKHKKKKVNVSPYLQEFPLVEQIKKTGIYKNRHKEYASSPYFDYKASMYDEVEAEPEPEPEKEITSDTSAWNKGPKIPVRAARRVVVMRKVLKKPSGYDPLPECGRPAAAPSIAAPLPEDTYIIDTEIDYKRLIEVAQKENKTGNLTLNIEIKTASEQILLTQQVNPFEKTVGELVVQQQVPATASGEASVEEEECVCGEELVEEESEESEDSEETPLWDFSGCTCGPNGESKRPPKKKKKKRKSSTNKCTCGSDQTDTSSSFDESAESCHCGSFYKRPSEAAEEEGGCSCGAEKKNTEGKCTCGDNGERNQGRSSKNSQNANDEDRRLSCGSGSNKKTVDKIKRCTCKKTRKSRRSTDFSKRDSQCPKCSVQSNKEEQPPAEAGEAPADGAPTEPEPAPQPPEPESAKTKDGGPSGRTSESGIEVKAYFPELNYANLVRCTCRPRSKPEVETAPLVKAECGCMSAPGGTQQERWRGCSQREDRGSKPTSSSAAPASDGNEPADQPPPQRTSKSSAPNEESLKRTSEASEARRKSSKSKRPSAGSGQRASDPGGAVPGCTCGQPEPRGRGAPPGVPEMYRGLDWSGCTCGPTPSESTETSSSSECRCGAQDESAEDEIEEEWEAEIQKYLEELAKAEPADKKGKDAATKETAKPAEEEKREPPKKCTCGEEADEPKREVTIEGFDDTPVDEQMCKCEHLYMQYLQKHSGCLALFNAYTAKAQRDILEYLEDLRLEEEEQEDDDSDDSIIEEEKPEIVEPVKPRRKKPCKCGKRKKVREEPEEEEEIEEEEPEIIAPPEEIEEKPKVTPKYTMSRDISQRSRREVDRYKLTEVPLEDYETRYFVLKEFPKSTHKQMKLLKEALNSLKEDGFPLAKLPECHKLPHFKLWLRMRSGNFISMKKRESMNLGNLELWSHTGVLQKKIYAPDLGMTLRQLNKLTWAGVRGHKKLVADVKADYYRRLKRLCVDVSRDLFWSMFHHELPFSSFMDCYFAYMPSDEHHVLPYRPWRTSEGHDMRKVSCPL